MSKFVKKFIIAHPRTIIINDVRRSSLVPYEGDFDSEELAIAHGKGYGDDFVVLPKYINTAPKREEIDWDA